MQLVATLTGPLTLVCLMAPILVVAGPSFGHRIVNGKIIHIADAPYTVQITDAFGLWICGGTLVSDQFVVSAAHCFESRHPRELRVYAGANLREHYGSEGTEYRVSKLWNHPEYIFKHDPRKVNEHMDVAVLKLAKPVEFGETVRAVRMCNKPLQAEELIRIVGWGRVEFRGEQSNELRSIDVPVFSHEQCVAMHEDSVTKITHSMVCAGLPGDKDACQGDSGGPAIRKGELCGIVSWGVGCADKNHPGIYTSIPVVRDFIDECMAQ
uniref:Peptidase S1 domain-containing protein n=1 Tax=Musca domestica TaxID=7370 RepID=A0A1I8ML77_MUSDO